MLGIIMLGVIMLSATFYLPAECRSAVYAGLNLEHIVSFAGEGDFEKKI